MVLLDVFSETQLLRVKLNLPMCTASDNASEKCVQHNRAKWIIQVIERHCSTSEAHFYSGTDLLDGGTRALQTP